MKKIILLFAISVFSASCNEDNSVITDVNPVDEPIENDERVILKLKELRAQATSQYFYNENGFVDSISIHAGGRSFASGSKKMHYNSENNLSSIDIWTYPYSDSVLIFKKEIFEYNTLNQIISKKTYNELGSLTSEQNYQYNAEGYLNIQGYIYVNGNLTQEGNQTYYTYDNKPNPLYEMFPIAYNRMNTTNKNNQLSSNFPSINLFETIQYNYNEHNYPTAFQKSTVILDDIDHGVFSYY